MFFTSIIGCHCQSHPMSLLAPKRTSATSPRPPPLCTLCSCLHLHKGYPFLPGSTLHSCCSALHKVQSLTGCRQVEIQPLRCLSIWGNIMWSREEKGHDNFMQNSWGKHPRFPPRGQSAAECLQFRWSLVQLRKCQKEKGILVRILMSR